MASRIKPKRKDLYEEDFFVWAERQAALLRAGRFDELDLDNVIEEVEELGGALKRSALNNSCVVVEHLLSFSTVRRRTRAPAGRRRCSSIGAAWRSI